MHPGHLFIGVFQAYIHLEGRTVSASNSVEDHWRETNTRVQDKPSSSVKCRRLSVLMTHIYH